MYVATPQGYRRKIGPRSRYGTTPDQPAYERTPQSVGSERQRVGTMPSGLDAHFGSDAMRRRKELDDREKADRYLFDQEKRRANQARKSEEAQRTEAKTAQDANTASKVADAVAKGGNVLSKITGGIGAVLANHRTPAQIREANAKQAAADRAKGRAKYETETGAAGHESRTPEWKSAITPEDQAWAKKRASAKRLNAEIEQRRVKATMPTVTQASAPKPSPRPPVQPSKPVQQAPRPTVQTPPAKTTERLNAAQVQARKNPQGLSARMNPPGATPKTLDEDPIAKPVLWAGRQLGKVGSAIGSAIGSQAQRNKTGIAARLTRFIGGS
jgi:hypothetical protein